MKVQTNEERNEFKYKYLIVKSLSQQEKSQQIPFV